MHFKNTSTKNHHKSKPSTILTQKTTSYLTVQILFLSILPFIYSATIHAETEQLNTMTVIGEAANESAEIGGTPVKELPINIHVVNEKEIERLRFVDPDELLDRIPGETQVRNLRIPNGGKGYTIPMVDGIPLESPYEGATQRIDRINTSDIQRIEVIKGPSSALYPNNAFGGVINVVTKDAPEHPETQVWIEAGELDRQRLGFNTGGTLTLNKSDQQLGYFIDINTRDFDGLRDGAKNDRDQFSSKLIYDLNQDTRFITRFEHLEELVIARGDLTAEEINDDPSQAGSLSSSEDLEQSSASFKVEQYTENGYVDFSLVYREKDTVGLSRFRGPQNENDIGISSKLFYRHDFELSNLIIGFESYDGEQDTQQYARNDNDLSGPFSTIDATRDIRAYFIQSEIDITQQFGLSLGARYESIDIRSQSNNSDDASGKASFSDTALKFGTTYDFFNNHMLWFGVSEGFYAPDIDDIVGDPNEPETANNNLKPEEALNIEVGLRGKQGNWSYDTSYYHNTIKHYLVTQEFQNSSGDDIERTTNAGQVTVEGVETVIEYKPKNASWRAGLTHTYARNIYDSFVSSDGDFSGNELRRSPRHHLNTRIAWLPATGWAIELEGDFYSSYYGDDANTSAGKFKRDERINLRISYEKGAWAWWLHGLNLSDTIEDRATYSSRRNSLSFRTSDGRYFYTGLSYQF